MATMLDVDLLLAEPGHAPAERNRRLHLEDGRITAVTAGAGTSGDGAFGKLAMPALVDAHDHGRGLRPLAFGCCDGPLELWICGLGLEPKVDPYLRAAVAFANLAKGGVAAANHCHNPQDRNNLVGEAYAVSRAARDVGIRIVFAAPVFDRNPIVYGPTESLADTLGETAFAALEARTTRAAAAEQLAQIEAITEFEHAFFKVQYGPVGPQWCEDATLEAIAEASAATGRRIHMHLFETERQRAWADASYPGGLITFLDTIGLLSDRLTVAHGVWLRPDECALMAERGVTVSVNTSSNLRLRSGLPSVARFKAAGLAWAMGLDGMAMDDDEDALRELRLLWLSQQGSGIEPALQPGELFDAVLGAGRRSVIGADDGVRLLPGTAADVLVLDLDAMLADALDADLDPVQAILTRATKAHIETLHVAGRKVVERGRVQTLDLDAATAELHAQAAAGWPERAAAKAEQLRLRAALEAYYARPEWRAGGGR